MKKSSYKSILAITLILTVSLSLLISGEVFAQGETTRVSVDSAGVQSNNNLSEEPSISSDGRYVAFISDADNLVPGDTNDTYDVFVHDRQTGQTTRVSVDSAGVQGNGPCWVPSISSDGRYVAFTSKADNLVPGDTPSSQFYGSDVFVHDRQTGQTTRVSVDSAGVGSYLNSWGTSISSDGRYVAFGSVAYILVPGDTNGKNDVFVHDRQTGQTTRVSVDSAGVQGNGRSLEMSISSDGRYVAFTSRADNLVPGDTNGSDDVFVHDRQTGQTTRVSVDSAGVQDNEPSWEPSISSDGRYVAFSSVADNLVSGDTNGSADVFVHDRQTGQTTRVSVDSAGVQGNGHSQNFEASSYISSDGRYVAFSSEADNLLSGDTNDAYDVFVHDRQTGQTTRVSVDSAGVQGNLDSWGTSISSDGQYVAFTSWADNLVPGDTNGAYDVFVHQISDNEPFLNVIYPNGGEILTKGQDYTITWNSSNIIGDIQIDLYKGGTEPENMLIQLAAATENDGEYPFNPPDYFDDGDDYLIGISAHSGTVWNFSDSFFTIQTNQPPIIDRFISDPHPATGDVPLEVTFTCEAHDPDPGGFIKGYEFDFGNSDGISSLFGIETYTYHNPSTYQATCTAIDGEDGRTESSPIPVTVSALIPDISVAPKSHNFGTVTTGSSSAPLEATISSTGTGDLIVSSISMADTDNFSLDFNTGSDPCGTSSPMIASGDSCTFTVTFTPSSSGTYNEKTLSISSNDSDTPSVDVLLTGLARQYFALLVGVDKPPKGTSLRVADDDAIDLQNALLAYPNWSLHPKNFITLINRNASKANVELGFQLLGSRMESEDVFLFMFSGHTSRQSDLEPKDEAPIIDCKKSKKSPCEYKCENQPCDEWLCTYDRAYNEELPNRIRDDEIVDWFNSLPTSNIVAILGNCFSGDIIGDLKGVPGIVVLTATDVNETADYKGFYFSNSPFIWCVIECINGLKDDAGLNSLSAEALYGCAKWNFDNNESIQEKLDEKQTPQLHDDYPAGQHKAAQQTIIIKNP